MLQVGIFNVRVVLPGDKYGTDDCLTLEPEADPLVEFYDATQFGPRGQFVARYHMGTVMSDDTNGLNLYGGVPLWRVSEDQMRRVKAYLIGFFEGRAQV